ncbi:leucine rich repeat (LRR) protein [Roseimicrobium gellanilyticum]|uniref:Leucine rich repeat (LRR) protein n=1 Tax=Roseimicrobium gellanilyticum TaxID=748857 RepID=A0A366HQX5_9BACT|nr:DUF1963 domain-containing protein [Roseimicrobium gellanilyticum]RBP45876.1 leucine rich repeat (LRR) protein [Roseimicrobium gellanilyticum]
MALYTDDELEEFPTFHDLKEALRNTAKVIRFDTSECQDAAFLSRVAELRNLQLLSISLSDVSQLLPLLGELKDLQNLHLQACNVPTFPESILGLKNLRSLSIGNCGLLQLPDGLDALASLRELRLLQNQLRRIPDCAQRLTRLTVFGLSYNQIEELPEWIGLLKGLECLFLDVNKLSRVPEAIGNLALLESLNLSFNKLRSLPDSVCRLKSLRDLDLEHNPFDSLPACLATMTEVEISIESGKRILFMDWSYRPSEKPPQLDLAEMRLFVASDSPVHPSLVSAIQEAGLAERAAPIAKVAREAIEIRSTVPDDYSQSGNSRLGGFPELTDASLFPKTDGKYWTFLAQLNLADIAPLNRYLPPSGLLSFFVDTGYYENCRVLFTQEIRAPLLTVRHAGEDVMLSPGDDYTQNPHRVEFTRTFSLPYDAPEGVTGDHAQELYDNGECLRNQWDHHINGYTYAQNESAGERAAAECKGQPHEWVPLLQLGWDGKVGFCFWDAGTLTFSIHQEDLRRWDFSNVQVSLETS